jgi:hypothetical protein
MRLAIFELASKGCSIVGKQLLERLIIHEKYLRIYYENAILDKFKIKNRCTDVSVQDLAIVHAFIDQINNKSFKGLSLFDRFIIRSFTRPYQKNAARNIYFNSAIWRQ